MKILSVLTNKTLLKKALIIGGAAAGVIVAGLVVKSKIDDGEVCEDLDTIEGEVVENETNE